MQGATKHREDFLADVSVFQDFQVTWKLRGEAQRSQGVAPNFSRPLESICKHSNAPHVISMCSPTDSRENKTCPAKHFEVHKGGKEEGWSSQRMSYTLITAYRFSLILTLRLANMGWNHDMISICCATSLQKKHKDTWFPKKHYVESCLRIPIHPTVQYRIFWWENASNLLSGGLNMVEPSSVQASGHYWDTPPCGAQG